MQTGKIGRKFRPKLQYFTGDWVLDRQYMGMKGLSAKGCQGVLALPGQKGRFGPETGPIGVVAHHRVPD